MAGVLEPTELLRVPARHQRHRLIQETDVWNGSTLSDDWMYAAILYAGYTVSIFFPAHKKHNHGKVPSPFMWNGTVWDMKDIKLTVDFATGKNNEIHNL